MAVFFITVNPVLLFSQEQPSGDALVIPQIDESPSINEEQYIFGDESPLPSETARPVGGSSFFLILRMLLVLALAALAIYGLVFFVKKFSAPKKVEDPYLKVLSSVSIGPNRSVHIINVGEKAWLVGAADNSVSLISEIDDKETIDAMLLDNSRNNINNNTGKFIDFKSIFNKLSGTQDDGNIPKSKSIEERRKRFKGF